MSNAVPKTLDDITEADVQQIIGWIGRHALPPTLPHTMPEYRTGLALDSAVTRTAAHLVTRLPRRSSPEHRNAVRQEWNLLATTAQVWSDEPRYPGWQAIGD